MTEQPEHISQEISNCHAAPLLCHSQTTGLRMRQLSNI